MKIQMQIHPGNILPNAFCESFYLFRDTVSNGLSQIAQIIPAVGMRFILSMLLLIRLVISLFRKCLSIISPPIGFGLTVFRLLRLDNQFRCILRPSIK